MNTVTERPTQPEEQTEDAPMSRSFVAPLPDVDDAPADVWTEPIPVDRTRALRAEAAQEMRSYARKLGAPSPPAVPPMHCGHRWTQTVEMVRQVFPTQLFADVKQRDALVVHHWVCTRTAHDDDRHVAHDKAGQMLAETSPGEDSGNSGGNVVEAAKPKRPSPRKRDDSGRFKAVKAVPDAPKDGAA